MGQNVGVEVTFGLIYFAFGLISALLYKSFNRLGKFFCFPRFFACILDVVSACICFTVFFYFYVNYQDGILRFYQAVFFLLGISVYVKFVDALLRKVINRLKKSCPSKLRQLFSKLTILLKK